mmetsp:Transcript_74441/g.230920  ORF Transcript_74441/g.230920 Transcript_74441/m.230920 type:complete len:205 (+) Transcript_74441:187-801(+)
MASSKVSRIKSGTGPAFVGDIGASRLTGAGLRSLASLRAFRVASSSARSALISRLRSSSSARFLAQRLQQRVSPSESPAHVTAPSVLPRRSPITADWKIPRPRIRFMKVLRSSSRAMLYVTSPAMMSCAAMPFSGTMKTKIMCTWTPKATRSLCSSNTPSGSCVVESRLPGLSSLSRCCCRRSRMATLTPFTKVESAARPVEFK